MARPGQRQTGATAPVQRHEVRIIGGRWKRSRLGVPNKPGLRPTPDRVRETLFNWLGQDLSGWSCLDAFAGTGALGFEAASRGARDVLLVERDPELVQRLCQAKTRLQADAVRIVGGDGVAWLRQQPPGSLDLVFLDPPFDSDVLEPALRAAHLALAVAGLVYLESGVVWTEDRLRGLGLAQLRHMKAGAVMAHLLRRMQAPHA